MSHSLICRKCCARSDPAQTPAFCSYLLFFGSSLLVVSRERSIPHFLFVEQVGMMIVGVTALAEGNINRILYGLDMAGNTCGTNGSSYGGPRPDFTDRKNLYWLDFMEFITNSDANKMTTVCLSSCPTDTNTFVCEYNKTNGWDTDYYDTLPNDKKTSSQNGEGPCYKVLLQTSPILNRCFPRPPDTVAKMSAQHDANVPLGYNKRNSQDLNSEDIDNLDTGQVDELHDNGAALNDNSTMTDADKIAEIYDSLTKQFSKARLAEYLADGWKGHKVILTCGIGGGIALSFVWLGMMRCWSGFVTWTTIILINFLVLCFTLFCYIKAGLLGSSGIGHLLEMQIGPLPSVFDPTTANKRIFAIAAYVATVVMALTLFLSFVMRKRVVLAIAFIKVASSAIGSMFCLLLFPLVPFMLSTMLVIWVLVVAVYLYSSGQVVLLDNGGYKVQWDYVLRYMAVYHLFGFLWTRQFINGFADVVIAGTISLFYWQRGEPEGKPLCTSLKKACLYHLGSVAVGSFVTAVLQFVRLIFEYMKSRTKPMTEGMVVTRFVLGMVRCFLRAVEAILTLVNRNAYIMVAIKGTNYCSSAGHALTFVLKNVLQVGTVNIISGILIVVGQLMIGLTCGVAAFAFCELKPYSDPTSHHYLSSPLLPVLCSAFVGYFVAQVFLQVYDMSIDTVMICFCEDCDVNNNSPVYAPTILMDALGLKGDTVPRPTDVSENTTMPREEAPPAGPREFLSQ